MFSTPKRNKLAVASDSEVIGTPSRRILKVSCFNIGDKALDNASSPSLHEKTVISPGEARRGRPRADILNSLILEGSTSPSSIKCMYCNRVFPREKSLQAHLRTHTGEKPYVCDYPRCTRRFAQSGQLKTHQRLHTGEKPFICAAANCSRRFTHANRHCPDHPEFTLKRFISKPEPNWDKSYDETHSAEIRQWLQDFDRRSKSCSKSNENIEKTPRKSIIFRREESVLSSGSSAYFSGNSQNGTDDIENSPKSELEDLDTSICSISGGSEAETCAESPQPKPSELPKKRWLREATQGQRLWEGTTDLASPLNWGEESPAEVEEASAVEIPEDQQQNQKRPSVLVCVQGGLDWLYGFMSRHPDLSLRTPESTSFLRSTGFNKERVEEFFENYISELTKYNFTGAQIYNLDETGIETVLKPVKIVTQKGKKQVGQIASGERGELVTFVGIINALGNTIPPIYVVPRMRNPSEYINDAPALSLVLGNKTGWMTRDLFVDVLKHIIKHTNCSIENRILILLDNHSSHTSYDALKLCKESGISILSFPPHTSHRLQPLDVGVYGPFKAATSVAFNDWLLSHPGEVITIRRIGELTNKAYIRSFTMSNIINSFKKPGIWPVNRLAFSEEDFAPSSVINSKSKELSTTKEEDGKDDVSPTCITTGDNFIEKNEAEKNSANKRINVLSNVIVKPSTSQQNNNLPTERIIFDNNDIVKPSTSPENNNLSRERKSFENIRPFPKAEPKAKKRRNNVSKSKIYTSTPELEELGRKQAECEREKSLKIAAVKAKVKKPPVKRSILKEEDTSDSGESDNSIELADTDDSEDFEEFPLLESGDLVTRGDFVIVKFPTKSRVVYYIGEVLSVSGMNINVNFLRRKNNSNTFVFPPIQDTSVVERDDILSILPRAKNLGTARTANLYTFDFNLKGWNIR